ncbi:MAG: alpha/beta hydrolase [Spirochaetes bacterium]|nr:alpha/beta hydrolase [Spirochaetota bacterium]
MEKLSSIIKRIFLKFLFVIIIFFFVVFFILYIWSLGSYKNLSEVNKYLVSNEKVKIEIKKNKDIFFISKSLTDKFLVFYPGGHVNYKSYSPICFKLAEKGINSILIKMPFNLAFFGIKKIEKYINLYKNFKWYICGHSLGGVAATLYSKNNYKKLSGLILLASYPSKDISYLNLRVLSIYATNDGLVSPEKIEIKKKLLPLTTKFFLIEGGNHSQFGYYGFQKGDLNSTISREKQIDIVISQIYDFIFNF